MHHVKCIIYPSEIMDRSHLHHSPPLTRRQHHGSLLLVSGWSSQCFSGLDSHSASTHQHPSIQIPTGLLCFPSKKVLIILLLIGISFLIPRVPLAPLQFNAMKIYTPGVCSNAFEESEPSFWLLEPITQFHWLFDLWCKTTYCNLQPPLSLFLGLRKPLFK